MSSPFYRSYRSVPSSYFQPSARFRAFPTDEAKTTNPSRRVISIPVRFVGSERTRSDSDSDSDSAIKIQKVMRGFLVRKSMKKIASISNEVHQIERIVSEPETIDLIKRDAKERLRLNETLMNLLLRLDCITSVDFGVRSCRKSVIKKAIALQEKLDLMVSTQTQDQEIKEEDDDDMSQKQGLELHIDEAGNCDEAPEAEEVNDEIKDNCDSLANSEVSSASTHTVENEKIITEVNVDEMKETSSNNVLCAEESVGTNQCEEIGSMQKKEGTDMAPQCDEAGKDVRRREEQDVKRELLQRLMEDNKRMMMMMAELCKRNNTQTRLLCSLSQRVEQLENTLALEKLRKKKKMFAAVANGLDKLPDTKRYDRKQ